jgi:hypothetical protein
MSARLAHPHRHGAGVGVGFAALLLVLATLPACTHYVPVIAKTLECPIADDQLRGCEKPGAIEPDLTYGGLLTLAQTDRQNLDRCGLQQRDLAAAVRTCNAAIAAHNAEIERSNEEERKKAK